MSDFLTIASAGAIPRQDIEGLPPELQTYRIETWGCQMNEHDSEKMAGMLQSFGLSPAPNPRTADIVLLNTCSVREKAAEKVFNRLGQLRALKDYRPHMLLGVCGCVAQQEQEHIFERAPWVDLVMGPRRLSSLPDLIRASRERKRVLGVFDARDSLIPEIDAVQRISRTRGYVTVMEGCNKTCTFCIVPFTRGREAYRTPEAILKEVEECVHDGLPEVQLLGQNVNAWRSGAWDFARLLGAVADVSGLSRLRFTTSHPLHFTDRIVDAMAAHPTVCRFLHLPLQSGSDDVLKRMKRGYTARDYRDRIARLRASVPEIALSTDIIVGFPGESEDDFQATLAIVEAIRFDSIYSFIYSPRPGTVAAASDDDVFEGLKKERLHRLQQVQDIIQAERNAQWVDRVVEVLVEGPSSRGGGQLCGRTSQNHPVNFDAEPALVGRTASVRITRASAHSLKGILSEPLTDGGAPNIDRVETAICEGTSGASSPEQGAYHRTGATP